MRPTAFDGGNLLHWWSATRSCISWDLALKEFQCATTSTSPLSLQVGCRSSVVPRDRMRYTSPAARM